MKTLVSNKIYTMHTLFTMLAAQHGEEADIFGWSVHILYSSSERKDFPTLRLGIVTIENDTYIPLEYHNYSLGNPPCNSRGYKISIKAITQFFTAEYWCHSNRAAKYCLKKNPKNISLSRIFSFNLTPSEVNSWPWKSLDCMLNINGVYWLHCTQKKKKKVKCS